MGSRNDHCACVTTVHALTEELCLFFFLFYRKRDLIICMKDQILFSGKNKKKKVISVSSAKLA